jgi:hypothetical protein
VSVSQEPCSSTLTMGVEPGVEETPQMVSNKSSCCGSSIPLTRNVAHCVETTFFGTTNPNLVRSLLLCPSAEFPTFAAVNFPPLTGNQFSGAVRRRVGDLEAWTQPGRFSPIIDWRLTQPSRSSGTDCNSWPSWNSLPEITVGLFDV